MKLHNIITEIVLSESRTDDAKRKYVDSGDISEPTFNTFVQRDPSGNQKYLDWMLRMKSNQSDYASDYIIGLIEKFNKNSQGKDIYSFKTIEQLEQFLDSIGISKGKQKELELTEDTDIIENSKDWLIVAPKSHESMMHYGGSTRWCVATSTCKHWDEYYSRGMFVVVKNRQVDRNNQDWKYAIHATSPNNDARWEVYEKNDIKLDFNVIMKLLPEDILEKVVSYISDNWSDWEDIQRENQEKSYEKQVEEYYEAFDAEEISHALYKLLSKDYDIIEDMFIGDKDFKAEMISLMGGEDEYTSILSAAWNSSGGHYGYDLNADGGYIADLKEFIEFVNEVDDDNGKLFRKILEAIDQTDNADDVLLDINARWIDFGNRRDEFLRDFLSSYMRFSQRRDWAKKDVRSVEDIKQVMDEGGYGDRLDNLKSFISECIKLKKLKSLIKEIIKKL